MPQPIPAAAGYPQYSGTGFIPPVYSQRLLEQYYCTAILPSITTTDFIGELKGRGDQITFFREPTISVYDYVKDGTLEHDTLELEPVTIMINRAKHFSVKVDQIDYDMSPMWKKVLARVTKGAGEAIKTKIDEEAFAYLAASVHAANQGPTAGVTSGLYNLGQVGAPVALTSANIVEVLTHVSGVLDEQCAPQQGRWIILPPPAKTYILNSQLSNASFYGGNGVTMLLNGRIPMEIAGFRIYISQYLPSQTDPGVGATAYNIIAGTNEAAVFAMTLERNRVLNTDKDSWSMYFQGLTAFGYDVVRPEFLANLYAYFA